MVNTSAIFRSKENESKFSEGDCCISGIGEGGRNFSDTSATITQNKTVSWKFCQGDFCRFLSPTFNGREGCVLVCVYTYVENLFLGINYIVYKSVMFHGIP